MEMKKVGFSVLVQQIEAFSKLVPIAVIFLDKIGNVVCSYNVDNVEAMTESALKKGTKLSESGDTYIMYWEIAGPEKITASKEAVDAFMNALTDGYKKLCQALEAGSIGGDNSSFAHRMIMTDTGEDELTGVYTNDYFMNRMRVIDRSAVIPVALICININDWKYANDNYGDEESDRLIKIVADILKEKAKPEYVIGRTDGDVFHVIIPMAEKEEAQTFCANVKDACLFYDDEILSPSVAAGIVMKTNVEEHLMDFMSEVEYEMFADKCEMKQEPGYRERLTRNA